MEGNDDAFSPTPSEGKQWILDKPKILLFETNWHEDSHEQFVALRLQGQILYITETTWSVIRVELWKLNYSASCLIEVSLIDNR